MPASYHFCGMQACFQGDRFDRVFSFPQQDLSAYRFAMEVRRSPSDEAAILTFDSEDGSVEVDLFEDDEGDLRTEVRLVATPSVTRVLSPGKYQYDLKAGTDEESIETILIGQFEVTETSTRILES